MKGHVPIETKAQDSEIGDLICSVNKFELPCIGRKVCLKKSAKKARLLASENIIDLQKSQSRKIFRALLFPNRVKPDRRLTSRHEH
jgi:hypothetical protein